MQYNVFKVEKMVELKKEMIERNYKKIGNELKSSKYDLNLYYRYDDNLKLSWNKILIEFGENNPPMRTGISGIILCESNDNNYAITYGSSSFLVQKYSDREFGFDFAKRINLKEMKRKSSMTAHSTKNSSITSYKNTKTIVFDSGENITSLSFSPEDDFYGKRIDIGKSIRFNLDISLESINLLFDKIEDDMSNKVINNIPLLTKVTNQEDVEKYNQIMYDILNKEYNSKETISTTQFVFDEFYIVGSSFYFEEDYTQVIKIGRIEDVIELHTIDDLFELARKHNISIQEIIEKGKFVYKDESNNKIYSENIRKFMTFEIDEEKVSLYNDDWYYYNDDYYDLIMNEIKSIDVKYNPNDDIPKSELEKNKENEKEYREQTLNKILCLKYNGNNMDREIIISKYENEFFNSKYKIELADLVIDDEYIAVKVGNPQAFSYCVDQSELAANLIAAKKVNLRDYNLPEPKKYGIWLYFESNTIFEGTTAKIEKVNSIMLLSKISTWSKNIKVHGKVPVIHVNKFKKDE